MLVSIACLTVNTPLLAAVSDQAYNSEDSTLADFLNTQWESRLPDSTPVKSLSIPGTHNSFNPILSTEYSNEVLDYEHQFKAGIRYFEIDLQLVNSTLIYNDRYHEFDRKVSTNCNWHGRARPTDCKQKTEKFFVNDEDDTYISEHLNGLQQGERVEISNKLFTDVLETFGNLSLEFPNETVFLRINKVGPDVISDESFEQAIRQAMTKAPNVVWQYSGDNPTLHDVRSKVVILDNSKVKMNAPIGLNFTDFTVQPDFHMGSNWDLYHRWELVKDTLVQANAHPEKGYINYLTGYGGSFSYFVASGKSSPQNNAPRLLTGIATVDSNVYPDFPRVGCLGSLCSITFEGMNDLTMNYIRANHSKHLGFIVADFPGPGLIQSIIDSNNSNDTK